MSAHVLNTDETKTATVESIMTREVFTVIRDVSISYATTLMNERGFRHLVVTDKVNRVEGIVSFRDVLSYLALSISKKDKLAARFSIKEIMVPDPITVQSDCPIHQVAGLIASTKVGCIPVVEESKLLVGILSPVDVLEYYSQQGQ